VSEDPQQTAAKHPTARLTPYELAFGEAGFEEDVFPRLMEEAETRGTDPGHRDEFVLLETAGRAIRAVVPDDAGAETLEQYRLLLYHAFHFWRFGCRMFALEAAPARYLVEAAPTLEGWELVHPYRSLYLQLPRNLFWSSITPDATPEPVDGFFLATARGDDPVGPAYDHLEALMVLGLRPDRAGFSVIPFDTAVGAGIAAVWAEARGRDEGEEFANILPGGDISGLYSILTVAEMTKFVGRALWYIDRHPESLARHEPEPEEREDEGNLMPPTRLRHIRVGLSNR